MIIYLDMDGVCTDFVGDACELFGGDCLDLYDNWPKGVWDIDEALGLPRGAVKEKIVDNDLGFEFWSEMSRYPHFKSLYKMLTSYSRVVFLSDPGFNQECATGKVVWLQKQFGSDFSDYILTPHKDLVRQDGILIDDNQENCDMFEKSILFPQPWNAGDLMDLFPEYYIEGEILSLGLRKIHA